MVNYVKDSSLVLDLEGFKADGSNPLNNISASRNIWYNLADCDPFTVSLTNFLWIDGCGWTGDGTVGSPYGLNFNQVLSNAYATASLYGNIVKPATEAFSIEVWAKIFPGCPNDAGIVAMHGYTGTSPRGWHLRVSNGKILFYRYVSADQSVLSNSTVNDGTIKHIVAIYNGKGNAYIYINGQLDNYVAGWNTGSITYTNSYPLYIGAWNVSSLVYFKGVLYAIRMYLKELSPSEILQNYNAGIVDNIIGLTIKDSAKQDLLDYIKNNWKTIEVIDSYGNTVAKLDVDGQNRYWQVYREKVLLVCRLKGIDFASSLPLIVNKIRIYKSNSDLTPLCEGACNPVAFINSFDEKELNFLVRIQ